MGQFDYESLDVEKSCDNCEFDDLNGDSFPCNICSRTRDQWKPIKQEKTCSVEGCNKTVPHTHIFDDKPTGTTEQAKHYQTGTLQPIEIMQEQMPGVEFIGFLRGNAIKYMLRMGKKDSYKQDAEKAMQYTEWLVQALENKKIIPGGKK